MKKLKYGLIVTAMLFLLTACQETDSLTDSVLSGRESEEYSNDLQSSEKAQGQQTSDTEDDASAPREGMRRSRLTNEWIEADVADMRPLAVMIPNEKNALPQYSLSDASILYEANVEGRMTRLMAIYEDWNGLEKIGNVRSLRTYYAYWAFEWDAFIVHCGHPFFVEDLLAEPTTQNINEIVGTDSAAFYRDETRRAPHNVYTTGAGLLNVISEKGYSLKYRGLTDESHFCFAEKSAPNTMVQYGDDAKNASYIDMSGCYPLTRCYFNYNEQDGLYYRAQHLASGTDGPHVDAPSGEQLRFKNILVQYVCYEELEGGYLSFQCHDTTMDGWFFTNGKGIHVNWEKTTDYGPTRFYDDYGNEIVLNTGKTMICIVEEGDNFTFR